MGRIGARWCGQVSAGLIVAVLLFSSAGVSGTDLGSGTPHETANLPVDGSDGLKLDEEADLERVHQALDGMVSLADLETCRVQESCRERLEWVIWTQTAPLEALEESLVAHAPGTVEHGLPTPPKLPDYAVLSDAEKREAWRAWYLSTLYLETRGDVLGDDPFGAFTDAQGLPASGADGHEGSGSPADGPGPARDLRGLWRLEGHGVPLEVLPGSGEGDSYLVTTQGLMHFPEAGARPDWMVRTSSGVMKAEPVFTESGVLEKIVLGTYPSFDSTEPSIVVLDPDGEEIASGLEGPERLLAWSLTDIDGDGEQDLIGMDSWGRAVAARLDGSLIYREVIEAPPSTGIVGVPGLPVYLGMIYYRSGMSPFGDVDGDGTLDFVVPGNYWTIVILVASSYTPLVQVHSGKDLQEVWTHVEPPSDSFSWMFVLGAADITGDSRAEVLTDYTRYNSLFPVPGFLWSYGTLVLEGERGTSLVRDEQTMACAVTCAPLYLEQYEPLGLLDFNGDGQAALVGVEVSGAGASVTALDLVVRQPGAVPGGPSEEVDRHTVDLAGDGILLGGDLRLRPAPSGGESLWIDVYYAKEQGDSRVVTSEHHVLQADGLVSRQAEKGMGLVDQNPATGGFFGWQLEGDRWVPLDDSLVPVGEGVGLVVGVLPMLYHDVDDDQVVDALLRMSIGYRWISGRTGDHLGTVDSPAGNWLSRVAWQDGEPVMLEFDPFDGEYTLYSLDREPLWSIEPDGFSLHSLADVTGDGLLELFVRESGSVRTTESGIEFDPGNVLLVKMPEEETLWSTEYDWSDFLFTNDLLPGRPGVEILLGSRGDDFWDLTVSAHVPEKDEALWSEDREETMLRAVGAGVIVVSEYSWNHEDADRLEVLEAGTGKTSFEYVVPGNPKDSWHRSPSFSALMDVTGNGTADLVYSFRDSNWQTERFEQTLLVLDLAAGKNVMEYRLLDPELVDFGGWWLVRGPSLTGDVGDWDRDGTTDLRLQEHGVPVVRSTQDGEILAVGPRGTFISAVDLNGDSRKEVALLQPGRLRMMMYSAGSGEIEDGNGTVERVTNPDEVHRTEEGAKDAFDTKGLPGPAVPLLLVLVGMWLGLRRRRERR